MFTWSINCEKLISVGSGFSLESPNTLLFQSRESTSSEFEPQWVLQLKSTAGHPVSVCLGKNILLLPIWRFTLKSKKLKYLYPINTQVWNYAYKGKSRASKQNYNIIVAQGRFNYNMYNQVVASCWEESRLINKNLFFLNCATRCITSFKHLSTLPPF